MEVHNITSFPLSMTNGKRIDIYDIRVYVLLSPNISCAKRQLINPDETTGNSMRFDSNPK